MEAFFCDEILQLLNSESSGETDDAELQIDALMLAVSQEYEQTLLTPSRPDVEPNLPAPTSSLQQLHSYPGPASFSTPAHTFDHTPTPCPRPRIFSLWLPFRSSEERRGYNSSEKRRHSSEHIERHKVLPGNGMSGQQHDKNTQQHIFYPWPPCPLQSSLPGLHASSLKPGRRMETPIHQIPSITSSWGTWEKH